MTDLGDPLSVFHAALAALNAEDWRAAAACCDPVSLRAFARDRRAEFASPPAPPLTVEQLTRDTAGRTFVAVAHCRRQPDGTWRLLADHDLQHLVAGQVYAIGEPDPSATTPDP